ncbi:hypothetical protein ZIOFF_041404 [Zingiber officinale]|uniref:Uncharacterized protein n=1 Tax=Zingiber officinale TaxID=94328 RepID=A0A8J5GHC5_ZINOF|nr:hypothetical protein ZIOFF_041404 [Zingiber officinale]
MVVRFGIRIPAKVSAARKKKGCSGDGGAKGFSTNLVDVAYNIWVFNLDGIVSTLSLVFSRLHSPTRFPRPRASGAGRCASWRSSFSPAAPFLPSRLTDGYHFSEWSDCIWVGNCRMDEVAQAVAKLKEEWDQSVVQIQDHISLHKSLRDANLQAKNNIRKAAQEERELLLGGGEDSTICRRNLQTKVGMTSAAESITESLRRTRQIMVQEVERSASTLATSGILISFKF